MTDQYFDPWIISLIDRLRGDLREIFPHQADGSRPGFLQWLLANGVREYRALAEDEVFIDYLNGKDDETGLKRLAATVYGASRELQAAFPQAHGLQAYVEWFEREGAEKLKLSHFLAKPAEHVPRFSERPFGVNLIGYVYGQLGIGEDLRMAARALQAAEVPFTLIDFPPGKDIPQNDRSMAAYVAEEGEYAFNLFCMTALEHGRCYAERGKRPMRGRYNIGYWPWELSKWPKDWRDLTKLVDEVWVSTRHTYEALAPVADVPVLVMPMAVVLDEIASFPSRRAARRHFGLPADAKLFCFSFDLNSSIHRKNPAACVDAFLEAFPENEYSRQRVGLVIKAHRPAKRHAAWEKLKALAARDGRIHIVEETLSRADLLALYGACDCFLSLHRAEGFGRGIAEALQLGLHVITTAYSGNIDFCVRPQADLVGYELVKVKKGQYPYHQGQVWAEADVRDAAQKMRAFVARPSGKLVVPEGGWPEFSSEEVGLRYRARLAGIRAGGATPRAGLW